MYRETSQQEKILKTSLFSHIMRLVRPYRSMLILSIIILLLGKGIVVFVPLSIKYGIDILKDMPVNISFLGSTLYDSADITLDDIAVFLISVLFSQFLLNFFQVYLTNLFGQNIMRDLRAKIFSHILRQSLSFFDKNRVGQLLTRVVHDVQTLNELFVTGLSSIIGDLFLIVMMSVIAFWLDYRLTLLIFVTLPLLYGGMLLFKKYARKSFLSIRNKLAAMNAFLQASIGGMKVIQAFNKENKMRRIFRRLQKQYFYEYLRTVKIYSFYFPGIEMFSTISRTLLIVVGGYWVYIDLIPLSTLIAFLFISPMFFHPLRELSEQYNVLQAAMASSQKIFALLETNEIIPDPQLPVDKSFQGGIEFRDVHFSYQEEHPVLKGISFSINPGEKVAVVGMTGSGKSTLINLISRLYDIRTGQILIDGVNIKDIDKSKLRKMISYVLQDVFIFSNTIKENIRLFDETIKDNQIEDAAENVRAMRFINKLQNGYHTVLGEHGVGISFGEKQLLAFARAFIHHSKIVIFDEATSNIDQETESIIQRNIKELIRDKTAIIIAHRLSTIKEVDKIIVLHKGEIAEVGNHNELIESDGLYKKLYRLQLTNNITTQHVK
ncbi:MAG: ABC transporter ATP-binding protein/permease [Spirochaetota bacterium]|nr:ABC transporter ATP-binding protein/permease [Spirochaetota bacterium]